MRAALRLALTGWLGLAGLSLVAAQGRAAAPPEKVAPDSAVFFVKVNNAAALREAFRQSQFGQLWSDSALKPFREDLASRLDENSKGMKEKVGVSLRELIELPQGALSFTVLPKDEGDHPAAVVITADAGFNADKLGDVLSKAAKAGEDDGAKVSTEEFKGQQITVVQPPKPKEEKEGEVPPPPIVFTRKDAQFTIGTDLASVKDFIANAEGRAEGALAGSETFGSALKNLDSGGQILWYADVPKILALIAKAGARGKNAANVEQFKAITQVLGIGGMKAAAGSVTLNTGPFDSVTKTFVFAPAPLQGVLKLLVLPRVNLKPEPWVPANVATYQSWSWDLDAAYTAINDLANMFQPGVLNVLEQQLVGPNGGEPISFKKDVFDPLGDRITVISDFKKPITEESQRMLLGVALEDASVFQGTLAKLIAVVGGAPKKREFQGTTIYDFDAPEIPNANAAGNSPIKGPISVAIAKNTLFVSTEPTLLEQVLRDGPSLADSPAYQTVAKEIPEKVSAISFVRPDESARLTYDLIKSGQFEKQLQGAAVAGGPDVSKVGKLYDKDKLPEFSVFSKYLANGGGYAEMGDDGIAITNFTLRKSNP
jgi:hypothetical protein